MRITNFILRMSQTANFIANLSKIGNKMKHPSGERNKAHILEVLQKHFDSNKKGTVLEISSGTGEHVSYFAEHFPSYTFQPSDYNKSFLKSIEAYAKDTKTNNVKNPIFIDVTSDCNTWNTEDVNYDYIINVNMMQVSPFLCTIMLFKNASKMLKQNGLMITYGPYACDGLITPQSNVDFDKNLRSQNPEWGIRDIKDLKKIAEENNIKLQNSYDLPSNNKCLVWIKENVN